MDKMIFDHCSPQFAVQSVTKSIEFYADVLGFSIDYLSGSPPTYAVVFKDDVYIHLCHRRIVDYLLGPGAAFISIKGIDELWPQVQYSEAEIIEALADRDYGEDVRFKIFTIKDLDENIIRIGEQLK
jgi:catechol 2,3-dioxygenase-like lactoylglutathione lyase family enzyme